MTDFENKIRKILTEEQCTFGESIKLIEEAVYEQAGKAFCRFRCTQAEMNECKEKRCIYLNYFLEGINK